MAHETETFTLAQTLVLESRESVVAVVIVEHAPPDPDVTREARGKGFADQLLGDLWGVVREVVAPHRIDDFRDETLLDELVHELSAPVEDVAARYHTRVVHLDVEIGPADSSDRLGEYAERRRDLERGRRDQSSALISVHSAYSAAGGAGAGAVGGF